jgi:hypothetical protein
MFKGVKFYPHIFWMLMLFINLILLMFIPNVITALTVILCIVSLVVHDSTARR